ncbi:phage minor head protein [Lysobacter yananisis]|uniref:Phage minor head protein n=1 Tax=Lysobacter yananisis TaxID=1003114 RepID=A0ABY9P8T4_9GAMM|nr:phage minor head protein [Lysobacter yananisis]WMT03314.1 phage minor head protein [Lysobacter yananisis]
MANVAYGSLPFQQQIAFFRSKENVLTDSWTDVWESQHDTSFMVAGANRIDLVTDLRSAIRKAIDDGRTLDQFRLDFDKIVARHGWDYRGGRNWRTRVIYETNLRQSYNAGRWHQQQALKRARPYLVYRHSDAVEHPRPIHKGWDGKVWHIDDPVWRVIYPQNGWGCQCYTESLNARDLKRMGKDGPDESPELKWVDVVVGQRSASGPRLVRTVEGVDPGFAYGPGQSLSDWPRGRGGPVTPPSLQRSMERSTQELLQKSTQLPAPVASQLTDQALRSGRVRDALQAGFAEFQARAIAEGEAQAQSYLVGAMRPDLVSQLARAGTRPTTAAIRVSDATVLRVIRGGTGAAITAEQLAQLPSLLRDAVAVLFDSAAQQLLYVVDRGRRTKSGTAVIAVDVAGNAVTNMAGADMSSLARDVVAGRLQLLQGELP